MIRAMRPAAPRAGSVLPAMAKIPSRRADAADPVRPPSSERRTPLLNRPLTTRRLAR